MKRNFFLSWFLVTLWPAFSWATPEHYEHALKSVVCIVNKKDDIQGSGVVVDLERKLILTNQHVVGQAKQVKLLFPQHDKGQLIAERAYYMRRLDEAIVGKVLRTNRRSDLAIIQATSLPSNAKALRQATTSPRPGQRVHYVGSPAASDSLWVYSEGSVRSPVYWGRVRFDDGHVLDARVLETQSPVSPGASGSPVIDERGALVALVQSAHQKTLLSLCVDISEVSAFLAGTDEPNHDERVRRALDEAGMSYEIDEDDGTFSVVVDVQGEQSRVLVMSTTDHLGRMEIREVVGIVHVAPKPMPSNLAAQLLIASRDFQLGACECDDDDELYVVGFCAKVDAELPANRLAKVVQSVAESATELRTKYFEGKTKNVSAKPRFERTDQVDRNLSYVVRCGPGEGWVRIQGDDSGDLSVTVSEVVEDEAGEMDFKIVTVVDGPGDRFTICWHPEKSALYLVTLLNQGSKPSRFTIRTGGQFIDRLNEIQESPTQEDNVPRKLTRTLSNQRITESQYPSRQRLPRPTRPRRDMATNSALHFSTSICACASSGKRCW